VETLNYYPSTLEEIDIKLKNDKYIRIPIDITILSNRKMIINQCWENRHLVHNSHIICKNSTMLYVERRKNFRPSENAEDIAYETSDGLILEIQKNRISIIIMPSRLSDDASLEMYNDTLYFKFENEKTLINIESLLNMMFMSYDASEVLKLTGNRSSKIIKLRKNGTYIDIKTEIDKDGTFCKLTLNMY